MLKQAFILIPLVSYPHLQEITSLSFRITHDFDYSEYFTLLTLTNPHEFTLTKV